MKTKQNKKDERKSSIFSTKWVEGANWLSYVTDSTTLHTLKHMRCETNMIVYIQNLCAGNRKRKQILFMEIFSYHFCIFLSVCMHLFSLFGLVVLTLLSFDCVITYVACIVKAYSRFLLPVVVRTVLCVQ